jgi:glycerate kinase
VRVLVLPDKFKGTLTAAEAADAIANGWRRSRPNDSVRMLPMSDGGDGFGEVMGQLLKARSRPIKTIDAAGRPCASKWWWDPASGTAVIESARVIGLAMLPPGKFHPFELDTGGLAPVITRVARTGARHCIIGIGGSATNDGGFGLARALGWQFVAKGGRLIRSWTGLAALEGVVPPPEVSWPNSMTVAVDVSNRLLGPESATRIYGPQKGLQERDFDFAECCLARLEEAAARWSGKALGQVPGTGAAGGLGFGLLAFLGAQLEPGFSVFAKRAKIEEQIAKADLVITGEGKLDRSSTMGKGLGEIGRLCRSAGTPCIVMAGAAEDSAVANGSFDGVHTLTDLASAGAAETQSAYWLRQLAAEVARTADWDGLRKGHARIRSRRTRPA